MGLGRTPWWVPKPVEVQLRSRPNAQAQGSQEQNRGLLLAPGVSHHPEEQTPGSRCPTGDSALARASACQENSKER